MANNEWNTEEQGEQKEGKGASVFWATLLVVVLVSSAGCSLG